MARLRRWWVYFRRGHSVYLAFLIGFLNFITIQYRLLVSYIGFLRELFPRLHLFALAFVCTYVPLATIIGWLDYKRLLRVLRVEAALGAEVNPWVRDLSRALILIAEGKNEEAVKILRRWAR